jgi:hypothetical protein
MKDKNMEIKLPFQFEQRAEREKFRRVYQVDKSLLGFLWKHDRNAIIGFGASSISMLFCFTYWFQTNDVLPYFGVILVLSLGLFMRSARILYYYSKHYWERIKYIDSVLVDPVSKMEATEFQVICEHNGLTTVIPWSSIGSVQMGDSFILLQGSESVMVIREAVTQQEYEIFKAIVLEKVRGTVSEQ